MATKQTAFFAVKSWNEKTWDGKAHKEVTTAKQTHAIITNEYTGALEGTSELHYLMTYNADGTTGASVGLEKFDGKLDGKSGTFVAQYIGMFDKDVVKSTWTIVEGSATGELSGLTGKGTMSLEGHADKYPIEFEYSLPE